jgi:outer membrane protein assembly factor BamB
VILCTKGFLVELDGATGKERRRLPIPAEATDCVVFANLSGNKRATDVIVKTRYSQIWAYDFEGRLLWTVRYPGGWRTAHQPRPIDIDGDGRDEIMAGYAMLNPDGSVRWKFESQKMDQKKGHLDCCRVLREGKTPEEFRLVLTCCQGNDITCVDGNGKILWEVAGHHFQSVQVGRIYPDLPGPQIIVDIDHRPRGQAPLWVLDANGKQLGQIMTDYCRQHALLDWNGDGCDEIIIAYSRGLFDGQGKRIATFEAKGPGGTVLLGDMTGDGVPDVTMVARTPATVYIFKNEKGKDKTSLGCGVNFTLY